MTALLYSNRSWRKEKCISDQLHSVDQLPLSATYQLHKKNSAWHLSYVKLFSIIHITKEQNASHMSYKKTKPIQALVLPEDLVSPLAFSEL